MHPTSPIFVSVSRPPITALRRTRHPVLSFHVLPVRSHFTSPPRKKIILTPIHPPQTDSAALVRLQADHVSRTLVPSFYRYLQAQDAESQIASGKEFHDALQKLVDLLERAEKEGDDIAGSAPVGLWHENGTLGWTDVMVGPCQCFTNSSPPSSSCSFLIFFQGCSERPTCSNTIAASNFLLASNSMHGSTDSFDILPSSALAAQKNCISTVMSGTIHFFFFLCQSDVRRIRYAFNRPNTSQVADAVNSGRELP
jgi:glutathione S-transferase